MNVLVFLIPVSLILGLGGLAGFLWTLKSRQYDDPAGDAERVLDDRFDESPAPTESDDPTRSGRGSAG